MPQKEPKNYEQAIKRLEEIASLLEKNEQGIDDSIKLFEEGIILTNYCYKKLDVIENKITILKNELGSE